MINRREALSRVAIIMGGTVLGAEAFLTGCKTNTKGVTFSQADIDFLNEVGETILPATDTPGAKAANVGAFMQTMVSDCYEAKDQEIFMKGMAELNAASKKHHNKTFMESTPEERTALEEAEAAQLLIIRAEEHRGKREELLARSDWTQVADAPVDATEWAAYRQVLRDITAHSNWPNLEDADWPNKPN